MTIKAPCKISGCTCEAEFRKGRVKYVMTCPDHGSIFFQSKSAKADVEKYLEPYSLPAEEEPQETTQPDEQPKPKPRRQKFSFFKSRGAA